MYGNWSAASWIVTIWFMGSFLGESGPMIGASIVLCNIKTTDLFYFVSPSRHYTASCPLLVCFLLQVLGGEHTFSLTLGILGYSLLPMVLLGLILPIVGSVEIIAVCLKTLSVLWSAQSAGSLLIDEQLQSRKIMVLYPLCLVYGYFLSLHGGA